jgi:glucose 1-dehydrogenase/3-oxoacyl-[acyl-carrier protein] reductase
MDGPGAGPDRFFGAVAIVTGGASGIGRATALRLSAEGAAIVVFDTNVTAADAVAAEMRAVGGRRALAASGDVRDATSISRAVDAAVSAFGATTHLVNAAGATAHAGLYETSEAEWHRVIDVNLKGTFLASREVARVMADGGAIVNIASVESEVVVAIGEHCQPQYSASKGGVRMLTRALAHELGPRGIRVNSVSPGIVATPMLLAHGSREDGERLTRGRTILRRVAEPEEIAAVVAFLLSEDASFITATDLPVDGGWLVY